MSEFRKRPHYYIIEKIYTDLAIWMLPLLARTRLTPNQVTLANYVNGLLILYLILIQRFIPSALLIQLYVFLDILDGNLARYTGKTTRLGQILDHIGDRFFYNTVMVVLGIVVKTNWLWIILFLLAHNLHGLLATYYIVPRIRQCTNFRRLAIKQSAMNHGYILGMDLSLQAGLISVLLVSGASGWIVPIAAGLYVTDLVVRLLEVWRNQ